MPIDRTLIQETSRWTVVDAVEFLDRIAFTVEDEIGGEDAFLYDYEPSQAPYPRAGVTVEVAFGDEFGLDAIVIREKDGAGNVIFVGGYSMTQIKQIDFTLA